MSMTLVYIHNKFTEKQISDAASCAPYLPTGLNAKVTCRQCITYQETCCIWLYIWSRSTQKHWPEAGRMNLAHQLASGPNPFGQNQTQSARTKLDQGCFCTIWIMIKTVCKKHNQVWKWETGSGLVALYQKQGLMILAHRLVSGSDVFGQNLTKPSRSDLGRFFTVWSRPSLEKRNWIRIQMQEVWSSIYMILSDSGGTLAVMAQTGRNKTLLKWVHK